MSLISRMELDVSISAVMKSRDGMLIVVSKFRTRGVGFRRRGALGSCLLL